MTENNYSIREIKSQHLKTIYKKYTDHIISFEKHIKRLHDDWVIDINNRNYILQQLDSMVRAMIKLYNTNLRKIYKEYGISGDSETGTEDGVAIYDSIQNYKSVLKNIYDGLNMMEKLENIDENENDPFYEIKTELLALSKENGFFSMDDFFKLYISDQYMYLLDKEDLEIFELYNKVFVPLGITIDKTIKKNNLRDSNFIITKCTSKCDSLMENTCFITIVIDSLPVKIMFEGYVSADILNIHIRTSQICSKHLFHIRKESKHIIEKTYPHIDASFLSRYSKLINSSCYFVNSPKEFAEKIINDYNTFIEISNKNANPMVKEFVKSDVKTMFRYINILLMGNSDNINIAVLLFDLLKDKKIGSETLSDIIYHNLSYYSQIKLKKASNFIKSEMARLKTLTPENISIEKKLASLVNMPDSVKSYILEKNNEIKSGENNYKLQMAINGLMQFPWKPKDTKNEFCDIKKSMSKSRDYLQNVAKKLDETVYGHENSKKVLIELVGKWIQNPESTGQVIGLVGPPGIGKTLLAKSISSALGIPLSIVGLGGMSDSADLIGHSFTYAGAQYGMIVRQMIKAGNWRSVMFFDEVDKVSKRNDTNEIYNTLIHITDPNMNQHFQDRFYSSSIEFDLSGVLIVFSYNDSSKLDPILLDRIKEINISAYSTFEKISIAQNYVLKELCENIGFNRNKIYFDDQIIKYIIEKYTLEAGVRELRRKLEQILLKLNIDRFYMRGPFRDLMRKKCIEITANPDNANNNVESDDLTEDKKNSLVSYVQYKKSKFEEILDENLLNKIFNLETDDIITITQELVHKYLDKPIMLVEEIHKNNLVGVVNGLYATSVGMGGIVPIQIYKNYIGDSSDGSNLKLKLTGNQKQVMRESVVCALTTAINTLNDDVKNKIVENFPYGFHIHAPDGGTPKDGPSAGCAFATAFVSILLGKKINKNIAMTGEIELTGKISKIGGLDAKLSGAKKAGVKCVYICEENKEDYENIKKKSPELFDDNFEIKIIEHIIDIVSDPNVIIDVTESDFDHNIMIEHKKRKEIKINDI
ncbi:lon protease-like protein [Tupanvirus deep ocean]|uniref:Lon protease-like protein n=2 Tax=Tupanvirus TaxID=2094720 RepID=A0AC62A917_9VIRU|nr:lon protease-like protein [Tupanvirus deep ocean]QKU34276.1 lon protease-like protein [Tupanvirus deep ocean]